MEEVASDTITVTSFSSKKEFEGLFNTHYSNMCSYANLFLKDLESAEEVVQNVFFKLWVNREKLIIKNSVESYLFRAVRNASLNVIKHLKIREEYKAHNQREIQLSEQDNSGEFVLTELEQKIREVIDLLPFDRRRIFIMSRYEGLKYQEIADKLGISVKTVENQIGRSLKLLKKELADYLPLVILFFNELLKLK
ncbi:MAG: RNA polymerase sigma-70 factor [Bacteroidales bacterium]|nr:RNA polymerase sigma-70 factor [Bacteroidales bacterium]